MNTDVTVVDYGRGNLLSVSRALEHCGGRVRFAKSPKDVTAASRLVLPGVGAFGDAMQQLKTQDLIGALREFALSGRPVLGICLGMQVLFDEGEEFGEHAGLGIIPGRVAAIPGTGADGQPHKIPHIGWNEIHPPGGAGNWKNGILAGVPGGSAVYFVHSFNCEPAQDSDRLADSNYNGRRISAAIGKGNIYGCQFHPEKSGAVGLAIVRGFLNL